MRVTLQDCYDRYVGYCCLVEVAPMSFDRWLRESQRLDNCDVGTWERQLRYGSDLVAE